jgi:hypothetical protein
LNDGLRLMTVNEFSHGRAAVTNKPGKSPRPAPRHPRAPTRTSASASEVSTRKHRYQGPGRARGGSLGPAAILVPRKVVNTSPVSCHRSPTASRSANCCARCFLRASAQRPASANVLRDLRVLVSPSARIDLDVWRYRRHYIASYFRGAHAPIAAPVVPRSARP